MATKKPLPYWIDGGTEVCDICSQPYVLQAERRCAACDCALCEHCVAHAEEGESFCEHCRAEAGEKEG
jgi:hypothetical protein